MKRPGPKRNLAASIRDRLMQLARARNEDFNFILSRYGMERFLYRISKSQHELTFILKGAMLSRLGQDTRAGPQKTSTCLERARRIWSGSAKYFARYVPLWLKRTASYSMRTRLPARVDGSWPIPPEGALPTAICKAFPSTSSPKS